MPAHMVVKDCDYIPGEANKQRSLLGSVHGSTQRSLVHWPTELRSLPSLMLETSRRSGRSDERISCCDILWESFASLGLPKDPRFQEGANW